MELRSCITVLGKRDRMSPIFVWLDVPGALGGNMRDDRFDLPTSSWWILGFTVLATLLAVVMGMAQVLAT
jgi:fumarate reductase subunit D